MKLSEAQWRELKRIADGSPIPSLPAAGYFDTPTGRSLVRRGLIETFTHKAFLGGRGTIGAVTAEWNCAEITDAGRAALADREE